MKLKLVLPVFAGTLLVSAAASAATGYTTDRVNLRAGPGRDYPTIQTLRSDTKVNVHGCIARFNWCDVSKGRARGWVDGDALMVPYQGRRVAIMEYGPQLRLPVITFSFDNYWDDHYRRASFYRDRDSWRDRWRTWSRDQDRDGVPNRLDRDRDGDGIRNNRDRDRDGDGVRNNRDDSPNNPYRR
jgi:uncharacterized protein YraI